MATLDSLASLSLPDSYSSLLQSSVQLGRSKKTSKQVLSNVRLQDQLQALSEPLEKVSKKKGDGKLSFDGVSSLIGTSWRVRNKKQRCKMLKVEKILNSPRVKCPQPQEGTNSVSDSTDEGGEDDGDDDGNDDGGSCDDCVLKEEVTVRLSVNIGGPEEKCVEEGNGGGGCVPSVQGECRSGYY